MFELNRRTPRDLEKTAAAFSRDVEVYVSGITTAQPSPDAVTPLLEEAHLLAQRWEGEDWLKWGASGMPLSGPDVAAHADAALAYLRTCGWAPRNHRGIHRALYSTLTDDETGRLSEDTRAAARDILSRLICATTGAPYADYIAWDEHPARTVEEVLTLLAATAAYARTYGPPAPAAPAAPAA
ncbi:DUF6197 family protein [Streptomyces nitrosporeus]|uniref:DUF6197 family protein n=1 Tax=Streptomyces nitrosporeus TaxID=28894 RepID=UPI00167C5C46|nr:hypothetical protein [Streptomyces nitrosporeus]GGZ18436.1 hypothetical protein GCM10010327_56920 [Streptomyces nitrosporeus]